MPIQKHRISLIFDIHPCHRATPLRQNYAPHQTNFAMPQNSPTFLRNTPIIDPMLLVQPKEQL